MKITNKIYTGIGSRETPSDILSVMKDLAKKLGVMGWTLRSGCAQGADSAFETGAKGFPTELYLPWNGFEGRSSVEVTLTQPNPDTFPIAEQFHPSWSYLSQGARKLHSRNVHQVLGKDIQNPVLSDMVICWTKNGSGKGGTGQALRMAEHYNIPIYDMGNVIVLTELKKKFEIE